MKESNGKVYIKTFNLDLSVQKAEINLCGFKPKCLLHPKRCAHQYWRWQQKEGGRWGKQLCINDMWGWTVRMEMEVDIVVVCWTTLDVVELGTGNSPGRKTGWREVHIVMRGATTSSQWKQGVCLLWLANCWLYREGGKDWGDPVFESRVFYFFLWSIRSQSGRQAG